MEPLLSKKIPLDLENVFKNHIERIHHIIDDWCLSNCKRITGFITHHLDYWDIDKFNIIANINNNNLIDYNLTHQGKFVSRLIITNEMKYKVENDDGFTDEGEI